MTRLKMVLGLFRDHQTAQNCIDALYEQGVTSEHINVLMSEQTRTEFLTKTDSRKNNCEASMALEGMGVGGAIGTAVGASLAALAAVGTSLVIPGLNLILAGPIIAALAGGGAGAVTGGLIGGLAGLGISSEKANVYQTALREGGTLVGVTLPEGVDPVDESEKIKQTMRSFGGEQIHNCC